MAELESHQGLSANTQSFGNDKAAYVFYEDGQPLYVGRTGNLLKRMRQHRNLGSTHNSAPFAYHLAKAAAIKDGQCVNQTRQQFCDESAFKKYFQEAKERVGKMLVRYAVIEDAREQSLFEYYASIELHTPWNDHSNS